MVIPTISRRHCYGTSHMSIVFPYELSMCFTLNYLCPCYHPSLFLSTSLFLCPLSFFPLLPDVCSPAVLRWLRGAIGLGLYGARTRSNTPKDVHANACTALQSGLLQQGSRTFVPESQDFDLF